MPAISDNEKSAALTPPAISANRFVALTYGDTMRMVFGEQLDTLPAWCHQAVLMSLENARTFANLILQLCEQAEFKTKGTA